MKIARVLLLVGCGLLASFTVWAQGPAEVPPPTTVPSAVLSVAIDAPSAARGADIALPIRALPRLSRPVDPAIAIQPVFRPAPPARPRVADKKFFLWTGLALAATIADVELTQRCLNHHTCVELNPLLPTGHKEMYLANVPVTAVLFYWSYRRKAQGKRLWWLPTLIDAAPHAGGAIDNMRFK